VSQILDIDAVAESPDPHAMLLAELADFVTRHRACGQITGDAWVLSWWADEILNAIELEDER
jgi:hypothetical protein